MNYRTPQTLPITGHNMNYHNDISVEDKAAIAKGLLKLLADSYALYLKTQGYQRNITAPLFKVMRRLLEEQNTELANLIDNITHRIRALGLPAPTARQAYQKLSSIGETVNLPNESEMIRQLIRDHDVVIRTTSTILTHAQIVNDASTAMLLTLNLRMHKNHARALQNLL